MQKAKFGGLRGTDDARVWNECSLELGDPISCMHNSRRHNMEGNIWL